MASSLPPGSIIDSETSPDHRFRPPLDLQQLHQNWPQLETLSLQLQVQYPPAIKGFHHLDFGQVRLTIVQAESTLALEQIKSQFDVFLGGPESKPHKAYTPPWQRSSMGATAAGKVAIIGAGISGVASAYSLSRRGFDVTLIEQGPALASAASGNRQGMLYAKLPDNATIAGQFHQQGLQHTMALLKRSLNAEHWQACGLLQLATSAKQEAQMQGSDFSRVGVADFPSGDCEVKTSQNSILDQNIFKLREENLKGELGPPLQHRPCLCGLKKVIAF